MNCVLIQQGCVPDYRLIFFSECALRMPDFFVLSGDRYFGDTIKSAAAGYSWHIQVVNFFFLGNRVCWQSGVFGRLVSVQVAILEYNPRILSNWLILITRWFLGRPTLVWGHLAGARSTGRPRFTFSRRIMALLATGIVAYTQSDAELFRKKYRRKPVVALGNSCVRSSDCVPCVVSTKRTDVVYVGRLVRDKKTEILLRAFLIAPKFGLLHIVGDGPEINYLQQIAQEIGGAGHVIFHGHVASIARLAEIYRSCVFSASPGYAGLSVIQSMAFGVPVALSKGEPHSPEIEACIEGVTSHFIPSATVADWVRGIEHMYSNIDYWQARSVKISQFIRENYTMESMADRLGGVVRSLVK